MLDYFLTVGNERIDNFGSLTWSDDIETYTTIVKFNSQIPLDVGRQFVLSNGNNQLLRCVITDVDFDRDLIYQYTAYDFGFYLGKNEVTIQLQGAIENAIRRLLASVNIPIGTIEGVRGTVNKVYRKQTVQAVLNDLLTLATGQTGINYTVDCRNGSVNIRSYVLLQDILGDLSNNLQIDSADNLGNVKVATSIQELRNQILVYAGNDRDGRIAASSFDQRNINQFGLLQEIIEPGEDERNFNVIAQNRLREKNRITTKLDVQMLGDDRIQKGVLIPIRDNRVNVNGIFVVRSSEHKVDNRVHTVDCNLELER